METSLPSLYKELDQIKNEIRVLRLEDTPGLVRCSLEVVNLDDLSPTFEQFVNHPNFQADGEREVLQRWVDRCVETRASNDVPTSGLPFPAWRVSDRDFGWDDFVHSLGLAPNTEDPSSWVQWAEPDIRSPNRRHGQLPRTLHIEPRFTWGDFEALSYCWESDERESTILLNGSSVKVSRNLEAALKQIRHLPEIQAGMRVWCDALCINQDDVKEKNHQVSIMGRIYEKAFAVLAWLGPESKEDDRALEAIVQLYYYQKRFYHVPRDLIDCEGWLESLPWKEVLMLLNRTYWRRLWIIQELAMNHHMTLFIYGSRQFNRDMLRAMVVFFSETSDQSLGRILANSVGLLSEPIFQRMRRIYELLELNRDSDDFETEVLHGLLYLCRVAECKDPKDKIYGIKGLLPERLGKTIQIDYDRSKRELYIDFASSILKEEGLSSLLFGSSLPRQSDVPSYVPDWTSKFERSIRGLMNGKSGHRAGAEYALNVRTGLLWCKEIMVDRIGSLSKSLSECRPYKTAIGTSLAVERGKRKVANRYGNDRKVWNALQQTLLMGDPYQLPVLSKGPSLRIRSHSSTLLGNLYWTDWNGQKNDRSNNAGASNKIWMDVMGPVLGSYSWQNFDRFRQTNAAFDVFGRNLREFFPRISEKSRYPSSLSRRIFFRSINPRLDKRDIYNTKFTAEFLYGRRLATTKTGYLALVPEEAEQDDLIAVLHGCNFPVVLRRVFGPFNQQHLERHLPGFLYIGGCYVHGLMDGEALDAVERGELEEEDVVLV